MTTSPYKALIVDDNEENRDLLSRQLERLGHETALAGDGKSALSYLRQAPVDLVLLDVMMPGLNGLEVLAQLKADPSLQSIPVIMVSAVDDLEAVVRCLELGADDYIFKPFKIVLFKARVNASLDRKRLRDKEASYLREIQEEREKADRLLRSILPQPIAEELKRSPGIIAEFFPEATVRFADIVEFTRHSAKISPPELVAWLDDIFSVFDQLAEQHGLEKIKTIGDAYMLAAGVPIPRPDHAQAFAEMALAMMRSISYFENGEGDPLQIRIGIHTGPVTAGVIGKKKFAYDLWGDAVNMASRMESHGLPNCIQVTESTYQRLARQYHLEERGIINVKGKGEMKTYLLLSRRSGGP